MPQNGFDRIETASRDEIAALQRERLGRTLRNAYENVPHYKKSFDAAGVHPDDLRDLSDLARFPFTLKQDLRDNYPFGLFAVPREKISRIHASSGTTGKPTVVGYTANDVSTWADVMARSIYASGGRPGMLVHVIYGYGLFTGGLGAHYGAERLGCAVVPMSGGMTERQVRLIQDFRPEIVMVTPSYMLAILDEFKSQGLDPRASSIKTGIFGAEPWTNSMRVEIENSFGMDAVDIYGLSEVIGPGVANECVETKDGLHVWEDHFYPEIVDPATGAVLPDGALGELVFTTLTKEAMPVIRYRTRDLTRLLPGTARTMRRMEKVTGRSDDMLIIRGVNLFPTQIEEQILRCPGLAPHYILEVTRADRMDEVHVIVEARADHADASSRAAQSALLARRVKDAIGVTVNVTAADPGAVERSLGKAKRVVDKKRGVMLYREAGQFKTTYEADMAVFPVRQDRNVVLAILAFAYLVVPFTADQYLFTAILVPFLILTVAALGLNILVGYCGQISLGAGAFMSVGAYAAYNFATRIPEFPLIVSILLGGAAAAFVGLAFGLPSLRIKGLYLAVATLAAQFFFDWLFLRVGWFTNYTASGSVSAPPLNVFGWIADAPVERYLLVLTFAVVFATLAKNLTRANIGRQWMAIRDMDIAAEIIGIRPIYAKLTAFMVSSFMIGVAGALWAFVNLGSWEPYAFSIDKSFQLLFIVIIGGLGSILGCFLGAAFIWMTPIALEVVPKWFGVPLTTDVISNLTFIIFGGLIVFILIVEPHGFARLWAITREKLRSWPFPY